MLGAGSVEGTVSDGQRLADSVFATEGIRLIDWVLAAARPNVSVPCLSSPSDRAGWLWDFEREFGSIYLAPAFCRQAGAWMLLVRKRDALRLDCVGGVAQSSNFFEIVPETHQPVLTLKV